MQAQTTVPARHHDRSEWRVPIWLGMLFGLWAAGIDRTHGASEVGATVLGLVGAAVVAVLCYVLHREQPRLEREARAGAYGVLFGAAMGYLLRLSGSTLLKASLWGLMFAGIMAAVSFYVFYTREV
jgi:hypothetical protein